LPTDARCFRLGLEVAGAEACSQAACFPRGRTEDSGGADTATIRREAMEQQTVSVAKAGTSQGNKAGVCTMQTAGATF